MTPGSPRSAVSANAGFTTTERAGRDSAGSRAASEAGFATSHRVGSMWTTSSRTSPSTIGRREPDERDLYGKFFHAMLREGVYLAPSQFEAGFIGLAHTDELLDRTVAAARAALSSIVR